MARRLKVSLSSDHQQEIQVADDFNIDRVYTEQGWITIKGEAGDAFMFPERLVVAIALEAPSGASAR